ncbi:unnamed protein product [Lota lota]
MMEDDELDAHQVDIDSDFEPQSRPRSCTWPMPCPEDFPPPGGHEVTGVGGLPLVNIKVEPEDIPACRAGLACGTPGDLKHPVGAPVPTGELHPCLAGAALDVAGQLRKAKSSRRNAWGNQSYADLITRAIESTAEKRLTLSQIYDWMVRYVPYFKDKGDSNSSAGWKADRPHNKTPLAQRERAGRGGEEEAEHGRTLVPPGKAALVARGGEMRRLNTGSKREEGIVALSHGPPPQHSAFRGHGRGPPEQIAQLRPRKSQTRAPLPHYSLETRDPLPL